MPRRRLAFDGSTSPTGLPNPPKMRHMTKPLSFDIDISIATVDAMSDMDTTSSSRDILSSHVTTAAEAACMETDEESCDSGIDSPENAQLEEGLTGVQYSIDNVKLKSTRKVLFRQGTQLMEEPPQCEDLKTVVEKMEKEKDLIGDGTRTHSLPVIDGRHKDLKSLTSHTVNQLLEGCYNDVISGYQIIDCRYPYEYEGGHIMGAINLHTEAQINDFIACQKGRQLSHTNILIFHCEFSSERGPKLLRHLRRLDRNMNTDRYPFLFYPEVYLLHGGYKAFYEHHQSKCEPRSYLPMVHESYSKQLRHFRAKSKSWTAGEKQTMRSRRMDISPIKYEF